MCKKILTGEKEFNDPNGRYSKDDTIFDYRADAGLRVGEDSILAACEDGNFKFVIYDNDSRDKDIIAIYKTD